MLLLILSNLLTYVHLEHKPIQSLLKLYPNISFLREAFL